ncbi:MAG: response regulator transcription factor [Bacteroidota bacterium]
MLLSENNPYFFQRTSYALMTTENTLVAIVEDDTEIRQTLALIIHGTPGFYCQETFASGEDLLAVASELKAQVVLMDVELPGINGIETVRKLRRQRPEVECIMLTIREDDEAVFQSLQAGASGFLVKTTPPASLLQAINELRAGGAPMSSHIARRILRSFHAVTESPLTERETEILRLICDGLNYRAVGERLFLSPHTVKTHLKNIYGKLHVHSRAEAVRKALQDKLI